MRKGQITMIVIIGLVALIIAGLFMLTRNAEQPMSNQAQLETAKLSDMVQSCLQQTGESAIRLIGRQGGYADIQRFKDIPDVRATEVVTLDPQKIVLWHEIHPCDDNKVGCVGNNRPPLCAEDSPCPVTFSNTNSKLLSIEEELENELASTIVDCVDFTHIPEILVDPQDDPLVDAIIREEDIHLTLTYPLKVTASNNEVVDVDEFTTTLPVGLPQIYRVATNVHELQATSTFIEEAFLHLLAIYSGVDTPIPPLKEVRLYGGKKFWVRSQVQQLIEQDILPFMNFLQLYNTYETFAPIMPPADTDPTYAPYATGAYQYLIIKLGNATVPLGSSFTYPHTPMYLNINDKELLKPESLSGVGGFLAKLVGLSFTQYKFKYDVSFPVIFTIQDTDAFWGEGYEFSLGLEANIVNNYAVNSSIRFLESSTIDTIDLVDPSQLVDHAYDITVMDRWTDEPVPDVTITYACGVRFQMGMTDSEGKWSGKLPYCFAGGSVITEQFGYLSEGKDVINTEDDNARTSLSFELWPRIQRTVTLYKRTPANVAGLSAEGFTAEASERHRTPLGEHDFVFTAINRVRENKYQDDVPFAGYIRFGKTGEAPPSSNAREQIENLYNEGHISEEEYREAMENLDTAETSAKESTLVETQEIDLTPGRYEIEGMLMYDNVVVIPPQVMPDYTINGTNFSGWVYGGVQLMGAQAIDLTPEQVYSEEPIILYVLEQPLPRTWDDVQNYQTVEEYQTYDRKRAVLPTLN